MGICARRVQFFRCDSTCLGFVKENGAAAHSRCGFAASNQDVWAMRRGRRLLRPLPLGHFLLACLLSQVSASLAKTVAPRSTAAARSARRARWAAASARGRASSSPSRGTGKLSAAGPHRSALLTMARVQGFGFRLLLLSSPEVRPEAASKPTYTASRCKGESAVGTAGTISRPAALRRTRA